MSGNSTLEITALTEKICFIGATMDKADPRVIIQYLPDYKFSGALLFMPQITSPRNSLRQTITFNGSGTTIS